MVTVFWDVGLYKAVDTCDHIEGTWCLHLQQVPSKLGSVLHGVTAQK